MTGKPINYIEIYPNIFVYKNLFKNISKTFSILKDADGTNNGVLSGWSKWSEFGEYINPTFKDLPPTLTIENVKEINPKTEKQKIEKEAILELFENFYLSTEHYISTHNIDFNKDDIVLDRNGNELKLWSLNGPSIARYTPDKDVSIGMVYHSDYVREPMISPGYKFAITALTYFNDDYSGGEIDFIVDGDAIMYKPEAGDLLVFPSGNPKILTKNEQVYLHGVMNVLGSEKYLARMYWMKYEFGDSEWLEKEKEFGKDVWSEKWSLIMKDFRSDLHHKTSAVKERRIR